MAHLNSRPHHKAAFVVGVALHFLVIRPSLGLYLPVNGLDRCGGRRAPFARIMFVCDQAEAFPLVIAPRCREGPQSSLRSRGGLKALGLQMKELLLNAFCFALLGFVDA